MDMLGFGASASEGPVQSIAGMAVGAVALLDALGVERASVLGHHTGAAVAIELAVAAPGRVTALVLSSAPWADERYRSAHAAGPGVDEAEQAEDGSHLARLWALRRPYYPEPVAGLLDRFVHDALASGVDPAEGHRACARYRMEDRVGLVTAPVLLLGASDDPFALPALEPLRAHLTSAITTEAVILDGGTIPMMEQLAGPVAVAVRSFLAANSG
jgi:pimeloyl-ACP methyl ester carboxylesterase